LAFSQAYDPYASRAVHAFVVGAPIERVSDLLAATHPVLRDVGHQVVSPSERALGLFTVREVDWTHGVSVGRSEVDVRTVAASLARALREDVWSIASGVVMQHRIDGDVGAADAAALAHPRGPLLPQLTVHRARRRVTLRLQGVDTRWVDRTDLVVLEPLERVALSGEELALVERVVARCAPTASPPKARRKR
jgi:hypothetical protein